MIIRKRRHREIAVIIPILPSHIHFALPLGRFDKVLGQELALFVEIVARTLFHPQPERLAKSPHSCAHARGVGGKRVTYHVDEDIQWLP